MPFDRVRSSYSDKSALVNNIFLLLTSKLPKSKLWFGLSVRNIKRVNQNSFYLKAASTSSAIFLAVAKSLTNFVHSVLEIKNNIYLTTKHKKITDTWIDHVRNVYYDYYGDYGNIPNKDDPRYVSSWEIDWDKETPEQYQRRIVEISQKLIKLFTPSGVTFLEVSRAIRSFLEGKGVLTLYFEEPFSSVRKYPKSSNYLIERFPGESDTDFSNRISAYKSAYSQNINFYDSAQKKFTKQIDTVHPTNFGSELDFQFSSNDFSYSESRFTKDKRVASLKNSLGSYTSVMDSGKKYFSLDQYGAVINCNFMCPSSISVFSVEEAITNLNNNILKSVKAAGVFVKFNIHYILGEVQLPSKSSYFYDQSVVTEFLGTATNTSEAPQYHISIKYN